MDGSLARRMATSAVLLGLVVAAFETTVVTSAMPTITRELGGQHLYSWVQGLGAGALQPTTMTISADLYTLRERAAVQGLFTGAWGSATVIGPLIGGWLVMHASWRWAFLVNVPVGLMALGLLHASYRDPARRPGRVDSGGPALTGLSLGLLLFALERGGAAALRLPFALIATVGLVAVVRQQRSSPSPLIPLELLRDRTVLCGVFSGLMAGGLLYTTTAFVPLWMSEHGGFSPLMAGLALVPMLGGWAFGSTFGVRVFMRGGLRASAGGGFALALLGSSLFALGVSLGWGTPLLFASLGLFGFGLGPAVSTSLLGPQTRSPWHHRGMVTSSIYATRMLGGSFAIAALDLVHGGFSLRFALVAAIAGLAALVLLSLAPGRVITEAEASS